MKISACMIVKNEEANLAKTLPSLSQGVDEIILVDTGSTDGTVELAKKYGAKVYHFIWRDDYAAARNESLQYAIGDWVLWVDADELIETADLKNLKTFLAKAKVNAYNVTIYESKYGTCDKNFSYQRVKLFHRKAGYTFIRPINEQLVDARGEIARGDLSPLAIYHWGKYIAAERFKVKQENYIRLFTQALIQSPDDPYYHFRLAASLEALNRLPEALEHYDQAYGLVPDEPIGREALEKKINLLFCSKRFNEAAQAAQALLVMEPDNISAKTTFAGIYLLSGEVDQSIELLKEILTNKIDGQLGINYALPNLFLSKAYEQKGEKFMAQACLAEYNRLRG
ncbi:glycosyltransferase [Candidatus Saganbacteria bacterium]|nr:glycosyltransferase [Candidatus Saganbacteria bacterium]